MIPDPRSILVIGDGIAGTAAAWRAAGGRATDGPGAPSSRAREPAAPSRAGSPVMPPPSVTVVSAGAGATVLAGGAVDEVPWEEVVDAARTMGVPPSAHRMNPEVAAFAEALDLWRFPAEGGPPALLATLAGRVRPARGHDRALLDLASLGPGAVVVPRADRSGWDADSLAACWSAEPSVRRCGLTFVPIDASLHRYEGEHRISDLDLAACHDDEARLGWLAERLREAIARTAIHPVAVLLGPWLGVEASRAAALERLLGIRTGEALTGVGSPAGMRFARARDRLLALAGVRTIAARVEDLRLDDDDEGRPSVSIEGEDGPRIVDRVVLACGGLAGGGIVYDPLDRHAGADMPERYLPAFRLSFDVSAREDDEVPVFASGGARIGVVGSMFGPVLDPSAWPSPGRPGLLESVGIACDAEGLSGPHLALAGDVVADRPRTVLVAVQSGLRAGEWASAAGD